MDQRAIVYSDNSPSVTGLMGGRILSAWEFRDSGIVFKTLTPALTTEIAALTPSQRPAPLLLKSFVSHVRECAVAELGPDLVTV